MNETIRIEGGVNDRAAIRRKLQWLAAATAVLLACFCRPLLQLASFTIHSQLFSYIPLIPFISAYLIWSDRKRLMAEAGSCRAGAAVGFAAGAAVIAAYWLGRRSGRTPEEEDYLALMTFSLLCFFWGACLGFLGSKLLGRIAFPVAFLVFAVPLPVSWLANIDTFFQYTSAIAAQGFFKLAGEPVLRDGLDIHLSGFSLRVATECSGIHSTMVLMMTALVAGYLFLPRFRWRIVLALAMIPLAILRNGFRVCVVGVLCVHKGPQMIDSPIHRKGGPVFFALSLIPFFLLLVYLRKLDSNARKEPNPQPES